MSASHQPSGGLVLLTGVSGYIGGRLLPILQAQGVRLRCLVRHPDALAAPLDAEVVQGDVLDPASLRLALSGVETAYYLVHSMGAPGDFSEMDRRAATNFGAAAAAAGVSRIIYLGGLGDETSDLSAHLRSRQETGALLRRAGVQVVEFRSSIVIGDGSFSFELVRSLVDRLPVMLWPKWVSTTTQPIAIADLLAYLAAARTLPAGPSIVYEIGGPDVVSYGDIMKEYVQQRGLWRLFVAVPFLTPRLSSLWLRLVTPAHARVGRRLIDSLRNPTVVRDRAATRDFAIRPGSLPAAVRAALAAEAQPPARSARRIVDRRSILVDAPPAATFRPVARIGGREGWYLPGRSLADPRLARRIDRRRRHAPRPADGRGPASGRPARLLAGRGVRAGPAAATRRGDEGAGARVARVRRGGPGRRPTVGVEPDRHLRSARTVGPSLLVRALPAARPHLPRHARPDCGTRRRRPVRDGA